MSFVCLDNVSIEFPILHVNQRSLKKALVATATGGAIMSDAHSSPVVRALSHVDGFYQAGDRVGLIGPNGAGKTTLLRTIGGIYEPNEGRVVTQGRILSLLDNSLGFNSDMTGRENIFLRGMYLGLRPGQLAELAPEIEAFSELDNYLAMPIRTYSSGMQLRLAFSIATSMRPDILLMDEWVLAGDASFVAKAQKRLEEFVSSTSVMFLASHSTEIIRRWCNKAMLMIGGTVQICGTVDEVLEAYSHR